MPFHNREIADLLEIQDANPFRVRACRNVAARVRTQSRSKADMIRDREDLSRLPDIGDDSAGKIRSIGT